MSTSGNLLRRQPQDSPPVVTCATYRTSLPTLIAVGLLLSLSACKKEEVEVRPDNQAPDYYGVPTVVVQNYVNRLFIDLLGREPVDAEMNAEVATLESAGLSSGSRIALVNKLMTSTVFVEGDSSYKNAYYQRQYEGFKARFLEGVSDEVIDGFIGNAAQAALADSLSGNAQGASESNSALQRLLRLKNSRTQFRDGLINVNEVVKRMMLNAVYDEINMNTFNFLNASFDNLLFRYPTDAEFDAGYTMVENNASALLFGQSGQNKAAYLDILVQSAEGHEGLVRLCYRTFLGRDPSTFEAYQLTTAFRADHDLQRLQRSILIGDEYAGLSNNQ
ncbi:MAG TPA: hypothetical protein PLB89_12385 [Flavobacteriales bacterium]|nr:hypothetical protein [Flavobacteriales bacterium]